jgi:hypothetical protein
MGCAPKVRFAPDSPVEGAGFEPSVPLHGELGALGRVRRDPRRHREAPERPIVRVDARFAARLGMDEAELDIGLGDFEHLAASLFAFSARFQICRDDRIVGRAKAQIADESGIP